MKPMGSSDTIAALATPPGTGGLAVVRVSGPEALAVVDRCFQPGGGAHRRPVEAPSHTVHYGWIRSGGRTVDEVLVTVLRAPRTFTREDVVEVSCHGGGVVSRGVLDTLLASGARLARPGEFTLRAFLNGRLDLAQAEAVADLIHARTDLAVRAAQEQLAGRLSERIRAVRDDLMNLRAHVEAHLDFPDEDIAPDTAEALAGRLDRADVFLEELIRTAGEGRILRHGLRTAIVGRPNVGKSSLLNRLLDTERAIVSPVAGTTRDTIEECADIRGIPVVFIDTAGLREADDLVEAEGIRRSRQALDGAEMALVVLDLSVPLEEGDRRLLAETDGRQRLVVGNKCDLASRGLPAGVPSDLVPVSCRTGEGLEALRDRFQRNVWGEEPRGMWADAVVNERHHDALRRALVAVRAAREGLRVGVGLEVVALEARTAADAVGEIVGATATEDLLDLIFSRFCLGK